MFGNTFYKEYSCRIFRVSKTFNLSVNINVTCRCSVCFESVFYFIKIFELVDL